MTVTNPPIPGTDLSRLATSLHELASRPGVTISMVDEASRPLLEWLRRDGVIGEHAYVEWGCLEFSDPRHICVHYLQDISTVRSVTVDLNGLITRF